jgi:[ribosomal protein S5]-alanine N-acetyltransferase
MSVFETFPVLETERFLLREITPADAKLLYKYLSDEEATRYIDFQALDLRWAQGHVQDLRRKYRHREWLRFAIARKSDGLFLGMCGFHGFHQGYRAEVGYELGREHWNQGVMTEVMRTVVPFGFRELGLHRIQALVCCENAPSVHLLRKLGFREEGRLRHYIYIPHREMYEDATIFGLLRTDKF